MYILDYIYIYIERERYRNPFRTFCFDVKARVRLACRPPRAAYIHNMCV